MPPPDRALVFGVDSQIGLAVVRELADHGVEVYGIGHSPRAVGLYSRVLTRGWVAERGSDPVDLVNRIAAELDIPFLLVVGEAQINLFNAERHRLEGIRPLIPEPDRMALVLDKAQVSALANELGIDTPAIREIRPGQDLTALASDLAYPVVLKWANPLAVGPLLRPHGLPLEKLSYCHDASELVASLRRFDVVRQYPLVQSYVPGHGLGQMFFMQGGEVLLRFQHRRLHEWPPEGGASTYCESLAPDAHPEVAERSLALLRRIGWEGSAMVEYRYAPATGKTVLMEINGRFWGSLPLAYQAGAPFAWLTYAVLGKGQRPVLAPYRVGQRCSFLTPELKRLHRILLHPELIPDRTLRFGKACAVWESFAAQLSPRTSHYLFRWSDPLPALADLWFGIRAAIGRSGSPS
jgi:predicted ATP-grasp superfamily ATP-dependent carboligase